MCLSHIMNDLNKNVAKTFIMFDLFVLFIDIAYK